MSAYGAGELAAAVLARRLRDGELVLVAGHSPAVPAACALAQRQGRWMSWLVWPLGALDPRAGRLLASGDERLLGTASAALDAAVTPEISTPGFFDFAVVEPLQIDRFGNVNTVCVGAHDRPTRRGAGAGAAALVGGHARRFAILLGEHTTSTVVERLDVCSGVGHHRGGRTRESELGLPPGGPDLVVTPLACLDFHPETKALRVASLHPGVALATVREATGCELIVDGEPPVTPAPTDEELRILRLSVDPDGVLRR